MILKIADLQFGFFAPEAAALGAQYHDRYVSAKPFPHIVLDDFLDADMLDLCISGFPDSERSFVGYQRRQEKFKYEFKPEMLSAPLRSFFYSFNSQPFVGFLESLTGIKGLIPDPHFAGGGFHLVANGGYLNIHADFNSHHLLGLERRVNVLLYLNKDWREEYGGCLELWDQSMRLCYEKIVPLFNRCVIFNTSSISFHGNPEPVKHPEQTPRRSIALYYYTASWDDSRRSHSTHFKTRPNSGDSPDFGVRAQEFFADITPPLLLRALRKLWRSGLARKAQRQPG